ncbi:MAG: hypothetical protein BM564_12170 [Bacteroidetes bacterium MedPE-SWsnd-G2]|nr:MAG: hypothetical protein BM564_12170 [Bacteroidetes bacterium MedPE-SWsnd-G2]
MTTETIIYIIIAGIIALLLALFQYLYKSKNRSNLYKGLSVLRFITYAIIGLLLVNPKLEQTTFYNQKPKLILAMDNSESIAFLNQDIKAKEFHEKLVNSKELQDHFDIINYSFGAEVRNTNQLTFLEGQSNMSVLFKKLKDIYKSEVAPVVFVSDGNQTYGADYQYVVNAIKQPIFSVVLGDTIQYADLKIGALNVNRYAYLKNKFPVEILINFNGKQDIKTELEIYSGEQKIYSKPVTLTPSKNSQYITANLPATRVGVKRFRASVKGLPAEKNTINNSKNFAVEIIDQKTNIAIVSTMSHPDLGSLKNAIETNEQRTVSILTPTQFKSNANNYQLVICYQPNIQFRSVYEVIEKLGLNKLVITGNSTNWSALNRIETLYKQEITNQTEEFQPSINFNYNAFIIDDFNFSGYPPLQSEFGALEFSVPYQSLVFKAVGSTVIDEPLIATIEFSNRREAIINGEGIWRWRAQNYLDDDSFETFDNFIGKLVQYLSTKRSRNRLNVVYESFYSGNDNVVIDAQYFNKNYEFDKNGSLQIQVISKQESGGETLYPFVLKNSSYEVDLSGLEPGSYDFKVTAESGLLSYSGEFEILDYNVEKQFLNANVDKLLSVSTQTKGKSYFVDNTGNIITDLISDYRFATIQKSTKKIVPLIDWVYLLLALVLCLSLEWFIRKYNGLI